MYIFVYGGTESVLLQVRASATYHAGDDGALGGVGQLPPLESEARVPSFLDLHRGVIRQRG